MQSTQKPSDRALADHGQQENSGILSRRNPYTIRKIASTITPSLILCDLLDLLVVLIMTVIPHHPGNIRLGFRDIVNHAL